MSYQKQPDGSYIITAGLAIDGDGANGENGGIACYVPVGSGLESLDYLANAGHPGDWWGIYTNGNGIPVLQAWGEPVPGAYISTTSYQNRQFIEGDWRRYLDAVAVSYIVVPRAFIIGVSGVVMGCKATVTYRGLTVPAMVGDEGPEFGEASIAVAKALNIAGSPKSGGVTGGVTYQIWPGVAAEGFQLQSA